MILIAIEMFLSALAIGVYGAWLASEGEYGGSFAEFIDAFFFNNGDPVLVYTD